MLATILENKFYTTVQQYYLMAIIAILIAHIINRTAPIAIAIFIVSSSWLVIALPLFLDLNDEIARYERVFGYRRGVACLPKAAPRRRAFSLSFAHAGAQIFADLVEETCGREPPLVGSDKEGKVLGHVAGLHRGDASRFESRREFRKFGIAVELGAVRQCTCPGKNRGDRIGRCLLAFLMFAVMPGHRAMRGLGFDRFAIRSHQHRSHEAERSKALRDDVGLDIAVIVLAGPNIAAGPFERRSDHVVDKAMFVGNSSLAERVFEFGFVNFLE